MEARDELVGEILSVFSRLDVDGSGVIPLSSMVKAIMQCCKSVTEDEVRFMLRAYHDQAGTGVDYKRCMLELFGAGGEAAAGTTGQQRRAQAQPSLLPYTEQASEAHPSNHINIENIPDRDRRRTFRQALDIQRQEGGFAGAKFLYGPSGLSPKYWGINKQQLSVFKEGVAEAVSRGEIRGQPDSERPYYYPQSKFDDPTVGPNMHQVNSGFIKPATQDFGSALPGLSYSVRQNITTGGLVIKLFFSHAWNEGVFEFVLNVMAAWPSDLSSDDCGAYVCSVCNPQQPEPLAKAMGDGTVKQSPFYRILASGKSSIRVIMVSNADTPIHERWWCIYEAFVAHELELSVQIAGKPLHLLTGELREVLRLKDARAEQMKCDMAAQIAAVMQGQAQHQRLSTILESHTTVQQESAQARLDVLLAADGQLIDLSRAKCSSDQDRSMILCEVDGRESAITSLVGRLVRDSICADVSYKEDVFPVNAACVQPKYADLISSAGVLAFAAWLRQRPLVEQLELRGCCVSSHCAALLSHAVQQGLLANLRELVINASGLGRETQDDLRAACAQKSVEFAVLSGEQAQYMALLVDMGYSEGQAKMAIEFAMPPACDIPPVAVPRYATGQLLLHGRRVVQVSGTALGLCIGLFGGESSSFSFEDCDQRVLPWRRLDSSSQAKLLDEKHIVLEHCEELEATCKQAAASSGAAMSHDVLCRAVQDLLKDWRSRQSNTSELLANIVDEELKGFPTKDDQQEQSSAGRQQFDKETILAKWACSALRTSGTIGLRQYSAGQMLTVRTEGGMWIDAEVTESSANRSHRLRGAAAIGQEMDLMLHPWNHAPRQLGADAWEAVCRWWRQSLTAQHSHILEAMSGKRLDVLAECVAIEVSGKEKGNGIADIEDASGLFQWLHTLYKERKAAISVEEPAAVLLDAPPAGGKTTLISQIVMYALESTDIVPIVVKVQRLQQRLLQNRSAFATAWNYVDAYLRLELEPQVYLMLRQAMMARRGLLLIDGLDEGGAERVSIEQHVADVLAQQGHVILATSRPAGICELRMQHFRRLCLAPLNEAQQTQAIERRVGLHQAPTLLAFLRGTVLWKEGVTGNPLMLSIVVSIFQDRAGSAMPEKIVDLYEVGAQALLDRGSFGDMLHQRLVPAIFFVAHCSKARVIEEGHLLAAARLVDPHGGKVGADADAAVSEEALSAEMHAALESLRGRILQDQVPLFSLLRYEPLQMQASHLSFQEFYTAKGIRQGDWRLEEKALPWNWDEWWANTKALGEQMDDEWYRGLLVSSSLTWDESRLPRISPACCTRKVKPDSGSSSELILSDSGDQVKVYWSEVFHSSGRSAHIEWNAWLKRLLQGRNESSDIVQRFDLRHGGRYFGERHGFICKACAGSTRETRLSLYLKGVQCGHPGYCCSRCDSCLNGYVWM